MIVLLFVFSLWFGYLSHAPTWHIRRGDYSKVCYLDSYTLLAFGADHATSDALERARGDNHLVATFEAAFIGRNKENVGVFNAAEANEVGHLAVRNDERRVLAVGSHGEVVVVVAEAGVDRTVDYRVKGCERSAYKDDVWYQGLGDFLVLAVDHSYFVVEWEKSLDAIAFEPFVGFLFAIVGYSKHMPTSRFAEAIPYRHPSCGLARDGAQC